MIFAGVMMIWPFGTPLLYLALFRTYHSKVIASEHYAPANQEQRRRSSAAFRPSTVGQRQFSVQGLSETGANIKGEVTGNDDLAIRHAAAVLQQKVGDVPAYVTALISMYELKYYW